ncbi:hypothetical protein ACP4OV_022471 [Aristida adscensionis]
MSSSSCCCFCSTCFHLLLLLLPCCLSASGSLSPSSCHLQDDHLLVANASSSPHRRRLTVTGHPRWGWPGHPRVLTYTVSAAAVPPYLPPDAVRAAFRRAFARWARVIPVRFLEADDADYGAADVTVGFYAGEHGDGEPFDGPLGVLGHAFSPPTGQLHLDAAERWALDLGADASPGAVDLESVAAHEIGHVLGLPHSPAPEAIMYPNLKPRSRKVELTPDDVRAVQALYGSNPHYFISPNSISQPDTSSSSSSSSSFHAPPAGAAACCLLLLLVVITLQ